MGLHREGAAMELAAPLISNRPDVDCTVYRNSIARCIVILRTLYRN
jgi:hypothetical protein